MYHILSNKGCPVAAWSCARSLAPLTIILTAASMDQASQVLEQSLLSSITRSYAALVEQGNDPLPHFFVQPRKSKRVHQEEHLGCVDCA